MTKQAIIKELRELGIWNIDKGDKVCNLWALLCIARDNKEKGVIYK